MDPHRTVWAVMVCLLGAARLSSGANCTCPKIPPKKFTVQKDACLEFKYRYECIPGYTRKAGTSGLIRCQERNGVLQWEESKFECIIDPNYRPPPTTTRVSTHKEYWPHPTISMGPSSILQSVRTSTSETSTSTKTERTARGGERTAVSIGLIGVILFLVVCAVIFFLYRQRNKSIPPRDPQELEVMKCDVERLSEEAYSGRK